MTGYVTKRYYRAPETMLPWQQYSQAVDIWSAACILAEMIEGEPLFQGRDSADQFHAIVNVIGSVPPDVIETICTTNVSNPKITSLRWYTYFVCGLLILSNHCLTMRAVG